MEAAPFDHAAVLLACARGDQTAFHALYDHEGPKMLALCQRLLPGDAENLLHDTFTLVWRNADQYDPAMGPARPWLYSVLRHIANSRRLRQNPVAPVAAPTLPPAALIRGRLAWLANDTDNTAYRAIAHAYLHGADYSRAAAWLRRSETVLRQAVHTGLKELSK